MPGVIESFSGDYRFLSNFYIEPDGTHVEGEYQRAKCVNLQDFKRLGGLTPHMAKHTGRKVKLRPDWEEVKIPIMLALVYLKFRDHPELAAKLIATGDADLIEGNTWFDRFWGVCRGEGENHLGKILMEVRERIRGVGQVAEVATPSK